MDNRNTYVFIQSYAPNSCFSKLIKYSYQKDKNVHSTIIILWKNNGSKKSLKAMKLP